MNNQVEVYERNIKLTDMVLFAYENSLRMQKGVPEFEMVYEEFLIHFMDNEMRETEEFIFNNQMDYNTALWEIPNRFEKHLYERSYVMNVLLEQHLFFSYGGMYYNQPHSDVW